MVCDFQANSLLVTRTPEGKVKSLYTKQMLTPLLVKCNVIILKFVIL